MTGSHDIAQFAATYCQRGWAVIPVRAGAKLPIETDWPNKGRRTAAEVMAAWTLYPDANVGILTGLVSGLWVLDVDPQNGGMTALAGLVAAYGQLPETYVVRTPSGGLHYYFLLPADFEPRNAQHGRRAGRLPVGIDVRGRGGQVVAPPSFRAEGGYSVVADFPLSPAPEWLLEMIRPIEPAAPSVNQIPNGAALIAPASVSHLWDSWVTKVFAEELERLARAPEGARDDVAFGVAVRLVEICNSDWNVVSLDDAYPHFMNAAAIASGNGSAPFTHVEADQKWRNAVSRKGGAGVPPPPPLGNAGTPVSGWVMPPLPDTGAGHVRTGGGQADFDQAGEGPANPFTSPGAIQASTGVAGELINGPIEQAEVVSPWELAVAAEVSRMLVREEAGRRVRAHNQPLTDFDSMALDIAALRSLPAPDPLVDGYLYRDTLVRINGPSGHGKSFVAVDLMCCVGAGRAWHGHPVQRMSGLYVVAEGVAGMRYRAEAWQQRHQVADEDLGVTFIAQAVQVGGVDWERFITWCARRDFGYITLDTQARNTVGRKENDATEMGEVVAGLDALRAATGACVQLVHHRGKTGDEGRGSTAIKGAMDTELDVSRVAVTLTVKVTKQKDHAEAAPKLLTMNPVGESMVLIGDMEAAVGSPFTSPLQQLTGQERAALAIAQALLDASGSGLTRAEAQSHARIAMSLPATETVKKMIRRSWADLVGLGRIAKASGREAYFWIELDGLSRLDANPDKSVEGGPEAYVPS